MEFAHFQKIKNLNLINYAPIVAQEEKDVAISVKMELSFAKENLTLKIPSLVPGIVTVELPMEFAHFQKIKSLNLINYAQIAAQGKKDVIITTSIEILFVKESLNM